MKPFLQLSIDWKLWLISLLVICSGMQGCGGGGGGGSSGSTPQAPFITMQPMDQTVVAGQTVVFSVAASGDAPFTYQWRRAGADVPGATGANFTLASPQLTDSGSVWTVVVGNAAGSVTSAGATLTVKTGTTVTYQINTSKVLPSTECENESLNLGACVGLNQTPVMPYLVPASAQIPPSGSSESPSTQVPQFFTGAQGDLRTFVNSTLLDEITRHSFVVLPGNFTGHGIYVNSRDRTTSPLIPYMSINPLYQFVTTPPAGSETDRRLMPWRDGIVRNIELSFDLTVAYVRRADEGSHAISHPTLELIDTRTRRNLYITVGVAQTTPVPTSAAEDYFAADVSTGKIIVSTSFRANPGFGERISGDTFFCSATATSHQCNQGASHFAFRLRRADIAFVIAKARTLDATLSADIADYAIDNFSFNNEVLNNAEIGLRLGAYTMTIIDTQ